MICFAGQICSGKTTYAKKIAATLNAKYIHFGTIIRNYAREQGYSDDRNTLQISGLEIMNTIGYTGLMELAMRQYNIKESSQAIVFDGVRHINIFVINSVNEKNIDEANYVICNILTSMLTGYKMNKKIFV